MAKTASNAAQQCAELLKDIRNGVFKSVYLLMGEEPYYPDIICDAIIENALDESERDFNQTICYGADVTAEMVISAARRYPMMAERQLVVLKEAQMLRDVEQLSLYCEKPLESTVLVILLHGESVDKRKALYKSVQKAGTVMESLRLRDYEIADWIIRYYSEKGIAIEPRAAQLLGEYAGVDLRTIAVETDKLLKNLPEGTAAVTIQDIERNVGISRSFSVFELTKALSSRNAAKALKVAAYIGAAPKFAMPMAVSVLHTHFYRILKYEALLRSNPNAPYEEKLRVLACNPYFMREYDEAARNYPLVSCMKAMDILAEYDFKGKGGDVGPDTPAAGLLMELTTKLLNV